MARGCSNRSYMVKGAICALVGASLWGFSGACAQMLYRDPSISPELVTAVRALVTALSLGALALIRFRKTFLGLLADKKSWRTLFLYGFGLFASQVAYAFCIKETNAGTATVLQSLFMVIVLVTTCLRLRHPPRVIDVAGLVCALVGTWLIATGGNVAGLALPFDGLVWGVVSAVAVSIYIITPKPLYERWGTMAVISAGMVLNAILACLLWVIRSLPVDFDVPVLDLGQWSLLVFGVGLVGTVIAYVLYLYGVSVVGSVRGSLLGSVEPLSAMLLAFLWLATPLTKMDWIGAAFMILMIVLVSFPSRSSKRNR